MGAGPQAEAIAAAVRASGAIDVVLAAEPAAAVFATPPALVVEAAADLPLPAKAAALAALLGGLPGGVPIAVATRAHTVEALLPAFRHGGRVVGLHLLPGTTIAEIAMPGAFDDAVVDGVLDLLASAGISALPCADAPGRIVDRLITVVALEAATLRGGGLASASIVAAAAAAAGLSLAAIPAEDLDVIASAIHDGLGEPARFRGPGPTPTAAVPPGGRAPLDAAAVGERLELAAIAEAYRLVGDAVAGAEEIERAMTQGAGWAAGPFALAGRRGLRAVVTGLAALSGASGVDPVTADRFAIPQLLWTMATV